jgi:hypothetical protein
MPTITNSCGSGGLLSAASRGSPSTVALHCFPSGFSGGLPFDSSEHSLRGDSQLKSLTQLPGIISMVVRSFLVLLPMVASSIAFALPAQRSATYVEVVNQADPRLQWNAPAPVPAGTVLGPSQLSATAAVPGSFVYTPGPGTLLQLGTPTLSVQFTPTDTNYRTSIASVVLTVKVSQPSFRLDLAQSLPGGNEVALSASNTATVLLKVTPLAGFQPAVSFAYSASPGLVGTFTPSSANMGTAPLPVTLSLHWTPTAISSFRFARPENGGVDGLPALPFGRRLPYRGIPLVSAALLASVGLRRRLPSRLRRIALFTVIAVSLAFFSSTLGCGETFNEFVTVTASAQGESHSLHLKIMIGPH